VAILLPQVVTAQTLVPGIHGISIVPEVKFTWVIVSSDNEISLNLRYNGNNTTPPIAIAVTSLSKDGPTIGGSQVLNAGWTSPNSIVLKVNGSSSLYDASIITVYASPYGSIPTTVTESIPPEQTTPYTALPNQTPYTTQDTHSGNDNNCLPSYPDFCIKPPPPTLNCSDLEQKDFTVRDPDPHDLDRDGNGIGCESNSE